MVELGDIRVSLREESENRVVKDVGSPMYECLASSIDCHLSRIPNQRNIYKRESSSSTIEHYRKQENIQRCVADLLEKHSKQFQSVLELLVDVPAVALPNNANRDHEKQLESFYQRVISDCKTGQDYQRYTKLCIYAAATCINTPIYILCTTEAGKTQWSYFQPLFEYDGQPGSVIRYITMFMLSDQDFHKVESTDISARKPIATGLVGMYLAILEDTKERKITVPDELRDLAPWVKENLSYEDDVSPEIVKRSCTLFKERRLIQMETYNRMTAHRATREEFAMLVRNSVDAFNILCQVLLKRRKKTLLYKYLNNWDLFVDSCDFLKKVDALVDLDNAIRERNICVAAFVNFCKDGGQELDERRSRITTTVIASSSVGIVSGGMVIAGIILAPFSFGASLGLSIAGGAIGVGTGVAAGAARTVEAVKQNTKLKDIRQEQVLIQEREERVAAALTRTEECFRTSIARATAGNDEGPGISKRGFLAVGSAFRAGHSIAGIALAAVRLSATAATVAASVLGPLSLVFDAAFLAEAAHNKATGDKTNAGELLTTLAETVDMKCKIFNNMLRGNCDEQGHLFEWT